MNNDIGSFEDYCNIHSGEYEGENALEEMKKSYAHLLHHAEIPGVDLAKLPIWFDLKGDFNTDSDCMITKTFVKKLLPLYDHLKINKNWEEICDIAFAAAYYLLWNFDAEIMCESQMIAEMGGANSSICKRFRTAADSLLVCDARRFFHDRKKVYQRDGFIPMGSDTVYYGKLALVMDIAMEIYRETIGRRICAAKTLEELGYKNMKSIKLTSSIEGCDMPTFTSETYQHIPEKAVEFWGGESVEQITRSLSPIDMLRFLS